MLNKNNDIMIAVSVLFSSKDCDSSSSMGSSFSTDYDTVSLLNYKKKPLL